MLYVIEMERAISLYSYVYFYFFSHAPQGSKMSFSENELINRRENMLLCSDNFVRRSQICFDPNGSLCKEKNEEPKCILKIKVCWYLSV